MFFTTHIPLPLGVWSDADLHAAFQLQYNLDNDFGTGIDATGLVGLTSVFQKYFVQTNIVGGADIALLEFKLQVNSSIADQDQQLYDAQVTNLLKDVPASKLAKFGIPATCDPTEKDPCGVQAGFLRAFIEDGCMALGIEGDHKSTLMATVAKNSTNAHGAYSRRNLVCEHRNTLVTGDNSGPNECKFVARAKRVNAYPDSVEIVWFDNDGDWGNSTHALWVALHSPTLQTIVGTSVTDQVQAALCNSVRHNYPSGARYFRPFAASFLTNRVAGVDPPTSGTGGDSASAEIGACDIQCILGLLGGGTSSGSGGGTTTGTSSGAGGSHPGSGAAGAGGGGGCDSDHHHGDDDGDDDHDGSHRGPKEHG